MSLLLLNTPEHDGELQTSLIETHPTLPLVASVWRNPCAVVVTDSEGEILKVIKKPVVEHGCTGDATSIAWHPVERALIIGWSAGGISLWSMPAINALGVEERGADLNNTALLKLSAQAAAHTALEQAVNEHARTAIQVLSWTPGGQFLLSGAADGTLAMWVHAKEEEKPNDDFTVSNLLPKFIWAARSPTPIIWASPAQKENSSTTALNAPRTAEGADEISFLLCDGGSKVYHLSDDQAVKECVSVEGSISSIIYDRNLCLLSTFTTRQIIDVFHLTLDFSATPRFRRKLALSPSSSNTTGMVLANSGMLAIYCGDEAVRIFDLNKETMTKLPFPVPGSQICSLGVERNRNVLAVGTTNGVVALYHPVKKEESTEDTNVQKSISPTSAAEENEKCSLWEALALHELPKSVDSLALTATGDVVLSCDAKFHVLHETVRMRSWDGVAAATQISAEIVVIESITGCQCLLKSKGKVKGISIAFPTIALWDGSRIDIYTINENTSSFSFVNFIPSNSPAFAIHPEGLLCVEGRRVIFKSFQGQVYNHVSFTEAEGVPAILNIMNDHVVAVSSKNVLRIACINGKDIKPVGPSRPLQFPSGENGADEKLSVTGAFVNAQGRQVAFTTRIGTVKLPDTRIWVYDTEMDKMSSFDFALSNEMPEAVYWNTPEPNANSIGELEYLLLACETHGLKESDPTRAGPNDPLPSTRGGLEDAIAEAMPNVESFAPNKEEKRNALGATRYIGTRSHNIVTFFSTRSGLEMHNTVTLKSYQICLVGLTIPDFLLASVKINGDASRPEDYVIEQKRLRDFDGLKSDKDVVVREALMKFSYYSTTNNMDEAYRCIKSIKNPAAWQALARLCVSNGRIDVAAVSLATIQDGVAARGLREAREEFPDDKNVQLASLACGLSSTYPSMIDECERLLRLSKRYDLITDVFLACGKFEQAQRHSEQFDRIRIRPVAYKYAQFMESLQNMDAAIMWYYNAKCGGSDVPRIYYQTNHLRELQELVLPAGGNANEDAPAETERSSSEDPQTTFSALFAHNQELLLWLAQHSERRHKTANALRYYDAAKDVYNVVRLLCTSTSPKLENAAELIESEIERAKAKHLMLEAMSTVKSSCDPEPVGAAFFLGQHYEKEGDYDSALKYYQCANAYFSAIRVAKHVQRYSVVYTLASASGDENLMLRCAMYLEEKGVSDKAVDLYRKIGATQCALNLCIRSGLFDTLHEISTTLASQEVDPEVFLNMAQLFKKTNNYQKAVEMLVFAKHFDEAITLCEKENVKLTEQMAESMTGNKNIIEPEAKKEMILRVANMAKDQGSWSLACKKFTQVGERMKALKMLMRGGEVEKVIFFANHSRDNEMYALAANFLQSQNWSVDKNVYRSIIQFYIKSKSYDSLLSFYDACAQMHMDDERNYPAALECLEECAKTLDGVVADGKAPQLNDMKLAQLKARVEILRSFVQCQKIVESMSPENWGTPEEKKKSDKVISVCSDFVKRNRGTPADQEIIQASLRIGDIFALLVKLYFEKMKEPKNALKVIESMPKHGADPQYYLEMKFMEEVCSANGKKLSEVVIIKGGNQSPHISVDE